MKVSFGQLGMFDHLESWDVPLDTLYEQRLWILRRRCANCPDCRAFRTIYADRRNEAGLITGRSAHFVSAPRSLGNSLRRGKPPRTATIGRKRASSLGDSSQSGKQRPRFSAKPSDRRLPQKRTLPWRTYGLCSVRLWGLFGWLTDR
jgi:hypothetical protein